METKKITLPEGWKIDKIEGNEIILKESKKELPKTWKGCFKQLGYGEYISDISNIYKNRLSNPDKYNHNTLPIGLGKPMLALCRLLVCREVYRQGWKPNYDDYSIKYSIDIENNTITKRNYTFTNKILSFPTEEIRDEFLNNFKDLIDEAKEFL